MTQVALQVLGLVGVDIVILILWTFVFRPSVEFTEYSGQGLLESVPFNSCNTNLNSQFEQVWRRKKKQIKSILIRIRY